MNHVNRRGGLQGRRRGNAIGSVGDARLRIIQKNRQKLTDARDKLAEIAKQSDARLKLDKLRENRVELIDHMLYIKMIIIILLLFLRNIMLQAS